MAENNTENREPLVVVENLKTNFVTWKGVVKALDGVTFTIYKGETLGLVGETGCGKSVTSLSIMGLLPPTEGTIVDGKITFEGNELTKFVGKDVWIKEKGKKAKIKSKRRIYKKVQNYMNQFRGKYMAMIFQEPMTAINPVLSIGYQLTEPLLQHQKKELASRIFARQKITNEVFMDIKNAVLSENREKQKSFMDDPVQYSMLTQINSIYFRKDLTLLQKNELIDELIKEKPLSPFRLKFLEDYANDKNKFIYKLPIIK
ncbi:MAG: ATP-binding cassette domain-containing protein, partial [Thermoplasmata archaeon]|nr:ATP-binding cassette domain-containing protein [Thermoplasmata archaeon]